MVSVSADRTTVEYDPATAVLEITGPDWEIPLTGRLSIQTVHGEVAPGKEWAVDSGSDTVTVRHEGSYRVAVELTRVGAAVDVGLSIRNTTDDPVTVTTFRPFETAAVDAFGSDTRIFEMSYGLRATASFPVGTTSYDVEAVTEDTRPILTDLSAPDDCQSSHYLTGLTSGERTVALGFLDHSTYVTRFDIDATEDGVTTLAATCPAEDRVLQPEGRLECPPLRIDAGPDLGESLQGIAAASGERMNARVSKPAPTGWCSWYDYGKDVTAADVRENVERLDEWGVPVDVVQIDDGYQSATADWLNTGDGFDSMEELAADIADTGRKPGLWLAPFVVPVDGELAANHPEWLVTADGEPVDAGCVWERWYGLDVTHPEAREWLREIIETVVDSWGFRYLKLDFLNGAALPGERYDATATRMEALRSGMELIREAAGDETWILAGNGPKGAFIGIADSVRFGIDVSDRWEGDLVGMRNAIRTVLNGQFLHRHWWVNDPDCQLLRSTTELTDAERRSFAALVSLSGGANFISDAIVEIDPVGRALLERTLPPIRGGGTVLDVGEREFPAYLACERSDGAVTVAAFNWRDESAPVRIDPAAFGIDRAYVWDGWESTLIGTASDSIERQIPPHGCALMLLAPVADHPRFLGTPGHLANGATLLENVRWDPAERVLSVTSAAEEPLDTIVTQPSELSLVDGSDDPESTTGRVSLRPGRNDVRFRDRD